MIQISGIATRVSRPGHDHKVGERKYFPPLVPAIQCSGAILAKHQDQGCMAHLRTHVPERVAHVRRAIAIQLSLINPKAAIHTQCQAQHREPVPPISDQAGPVGRASGRQKPEITDLQLVPNFQGGAQVTVMHRVKGTPKNSDCPCGIAFHGAHRAHTR